MSSIGFSDNQKAGDMLGEVYEYFLDQFAKEAVQSVKDLSGCAYLIVVKC